MRAFLAVLIYAVLAPAAAQAALIVCNPHEVTRTVAVGYPDGSTWVSAGWWNIEQGDCATVVTGNLSGPYFYFESRPGFGVDGSGRQLCLELEAFNLRNPVECDPAVHTTVSFKPLDFGGKKGDFEFDLPRLAPERSMQQSVFWYGTVGAPPRDWGRSGDWSIHVADRLRRSPACFAMKSFSDGTTLRVGFDPFRSDRYLFSFGNAEWASLDRNDDYELSVRFAGRANWTIGSSATSPMTGWPVFLSHRSLGGQFLQDFRLGSTMEIRYQDRRIARLSLSGTSNAIREIEACQSSLGVSNPRPGGSGGSSDDPFAD